MCASASVELAYREPFEADLGVSAGGEVVGSVERRQQTGKPLASGRQRHSGRGLRLRKKEKKRKTEKKEKERKRKKSIECE